MPYLSSQSSSLADDEAYYFALAVIKGDIRLVQSMFSVKHQRAYDSSATSIIIYPALGNDSSRHQNVQTRASHYIPARSDDDNAS
jgi:hypothetical protein